VRDFEKRAAHAGRWIQRHPDGWRYIPVQDFGGSACDVWWSLGTDAFFLQVWGAEEDFLERPAGLYFRYAPGSPPYYILVAILEDVSVTRAAVEEAMSSFMQFLPLQETPESLTLVATPAA
jgi:hypothetical protein